jgi:hypothetical protein
MRKNKKLIYLLFFMSLATLAANTALAELVVYYPLNEGAGTTAADASGKGHNGTIIGANVQWVGSTEGYGSALDFPGSWGQYCDTGTWNPSAATGRISVAFWMKWDGDNGGYQGVVAKRDAWAEESTMWCIEIDADSLMMNWHRFGSWVDVGISPRVGEWQHIVYTFDGTTARSYIDGNLHREASGFTFGPATGAHVVFGAVEPDNNPFNGTLDEVRIYDHALSPAEIKSLSAKFGAGKPNPADGAVISQTSTALSWSPGTFADSHHVYFGDNYDAVYNGTGDTDKGVQTWAVYWAANLEMGKTYYWRIDEISATHPDSPWRGAIWSFTIPSKKAWQPSPPDGSIYIDPNVALGWTGGFGAFLHHVYLGQDFDAVKNADTSDATGIYRGPTGTPTYTPPVTLPFETQYCWRVDEFDGTAMHKGDVWTFTTTPPGLGTILREVWEGIGGDSVADLTGSPSYPDNPSWSDELTELDFWDLGLDDYGSRLHGWLYVPAAGDYTFWITSDNGSELWLSTDDDPGNVGTTPIAQVPGANWTGHYEWDKFPEQKSAPIALDSGRYYIEVLMKEGGGGDGVVVAWEGPAIPTRAVIQGIYLKRYEAISAMGPKPANRATDVSQTPTLSWKAGSKAAKHDVYFGTSATAVANADPTTPGVYRGQQNLGATTYVPPESPLAWNTTYYWRIDEVNNLEPESPWKGIVWSFTTANYVIVDNFEDYDDFCNRIFYAWKDGYGFSADPACGVTVYNGNGSSSIVGGTQAPFAEQIIVHSGNQSMPMVYDNTGATGKARYSETQQEWAAAQDWTKDGVKSLTVWFRGLPESMGSFSYNPSTDLYAMTGSGADIWDIPAGTPPFHDEFHFAYKRLSGAGSIQAKVLSVSPTHDWAKAGVMIRETLDPESVHAMMVVTPASGVAFQRRPTTGGASEGDTQAAIVAPQWVKLERTLAGRFAAYYSDNGSTWTPLGSSMPISMQADVYIGLAVTSHDAGATCTAQFSNVTTGGSITGQWQSQDIGIPTNTADQLYVGVEDATGKSAVVNHGDLNIVLSDTWQEWNIDLQKFTNVNLKSIKKMYLGVGNRNNPQLGGSGTLYFDDIRLYRPRCMPGLVKPAADFNSNCVVDYPDLQIMTDNWLAAGAAPDDTKLAAHYQIEGNFNDSSSYTGLHHGDPRNGASIVTDPVRGQVASFDGANDHVDCGTFNPSAATGRLTVALWAKWNGLSGMYQGLIGKRDTWAAADMMWQIEANIDDGTLGFFREGSAPYDGDPVLPVGEWAHVAATFDGTTATFYLNGKATGSGAFSFGTDTAARVVFGSCEANGGNPFNGDLDDVRLYDYALSAAQVFYLAEPQVDLNNDGTVDLADFALLTDMWLDELLWP